jgi:hypothetical protein
MGMPAYFNKSESIKSKANKREAKVYKHLVSGALSYKGDFSDAESLIDNKSTEKKSIKVTEDMLQKLLEDTLTMNKKYAILILDLPNFYVVGKVVKKDKSDGPKNK